MPAPIASWSPARDVWETVDSIDLFSELPGVWSETFPPSGMTRRGKLSRLPMWAHHTNEPESSFSVLMPSPRTSDTNGAGEHGTVGPDLRTVVRTLPTPTASDANDRQASENWAGHDLVSTVKMLPTPRATDGTKGGPNQRGSSGDLMLSSAVAQLPQASLPPTPRTTDGTNSMTAPAALQHARDGWGSLPEVLGLALSTGELMSLLSDDGSEPPAA